MLLLTFNVDSKLVIPDIGISTKLSPLPENNVALIVPLTFNLLIKFVVVPIPTLPFISIVILGADKDAPDEVWNWISLASFKYVVDVILLRVSEEYLGIPNSIPETCDGKFWSASILTKLLLLWIICNFCLGLFVPIPIYPELVKLIISLITLLEPLCIVKIELEFDIRQSILLDEAPKISFSPLMNSIFVEEFSKRISCNLIAALFWTTWSDVWGVLVLIPIYPELVKLIISLITLLEPLCIVKIELEFDIRQSILLDEAPKISFSPLMNSIFVEDSSVRRSCNLIAALFWTTWSDVWGIVVPIPIRRI